MKKNKKMFTMVGSLALVGAVAVGATLAYLSDNTSTITNTFTVGNNIGVSISETAKDGTGRHYVTDTAWTNPYGDLTIGNPEIKDPKVKLDPDSNNSYIYIYVDGLDELKNLNLDGESSTTPDFQVLTNGKDDPYVLNDNWVKIANDIDLNYSTENTDETLDGIYVYYDEGVKAIKNNGFETESLFDQIMINEDITSFAADAKNQLAESNIVLAAAAVQADHNEDNADALAIDLFRDNLHYNDNN